MLWLLLLVSNAHAASDSELWLRNRIVREALTQAEAMSPDWQPEQRDCAGFVRFLFHKSAGQNQPLWTDRKGQKKYFVSAGELIANNFRLVGRQPSKLKLKSGDILVYKREHVRPDDAWHLMVVLEPPQGGIGRELVVYHNGDKKKGELRKLWLNDLDSFDSGQWRASASNQNFLGVYRWQKLQ